MEDRHRSGSRCGHGLRCIGSVRCRQRPATGHSAAKCRRGHARQRHVCDPIQLHIEPPNQACPGDNTQGWFFSPYLTADDPAALTFSAAGSPVSAGTGRTVALRDTGGNLQRNIFPNLVDGLIVSFPDLSLAQTFATTPLAPGDYNIGIACYNANAVNGLAVRENARYWNTEIWVTESAGVFSWTTDLSEAPAPVIGAVERRADVGHGELHPDGGIACCHRLHGHGDTAQPGWPGLRPNCPSHLERRRSRSAV